MIKKCLITAREIVEFVDMGKEMASVREYIRKKYPEWVDHSRALQMTNLSAESFRKAIQTLFERKEIDTRNSHYTRKSIDNTKPQYRLAPNNDGEFKEDSLPVEEERNYQEA